MKKSGTQNCTVTFKRFAFKRLNTGRFPVTIETLEKVENSVYWTSNDFIKVSLIRTQGHKVLVFGLTKWITLKSRMTFQEHYLKTPLVNSKLNKKNLIVSKKWAIPCSSQEHSWTMSLKTGRYGSCKTKNSKTTKTLYCEDNKALAFVCDSLWWTLNETYEISIGS